MDDSAGQPRRDNASAPRGNSRADRLDSTPTPTRLDSRTDSRLRLVPRLASDNMAEIARAKPEDCLALADIQFDAFEPSLIHQRVFGRVSKENHSKHLGNRFEKLLAEDGCEVFKAFVPDGQGNDKLVGVAFWDLPKDEATKAEEKRKEDAKTDEEKREDKVKRYPEGTDVDLAQDFFGRLDPKTDEPFYHLHVLAIDPVVQRTGAGGKLLRWGCKEADERGVAAYLEATEEGIGLYRKHGFEFWKDPIVGGENGELSLQPMRRPPLELRTFRRSDYPAMCEIYFEGFRPTTIWQYNYSKVSRESSDRYFKRRLENYFDEIDNDGITCTDKKEVIVAVRGNQVLGFAVWEKTPDKSEHKKDSSTPWSFPEGGDADRAKEFLTMIKDAADQHEKKHWFGKSMYESLGFEEYGSPVVAPQDPAVVNWPMKLEH
ncbi:hypothetical protein JCM11491_002607 [Sporobolomyces phaffii]